MTSAALRRGKDEAPVVATARAALYLRVSTGRQADSDLSIPDQRRQIEGYCLSRGWEVAAELVHDDLAQPLGVDAVECRTHCLDDVRLAHDLVVPDEGADCQLVGVGVDHEEAVTLQASTPARALQV